MLPEERRQRILSLLAQNGSVSVAQLTAMFGVSAPTIHRDLVELERRHLLSRTYGGALVVTDRTYVDVPLSEKVTRHKEEKQRIAACAASLVNDNETLILDEGSTCLEIARSLKNKRGLVVITNGIQIALELTPCRDITTIMIGGICGHHNFVAYGPETEQAYSRVRAQKYFMGIDAMSLTDGIMDGNMIQTSLKRAKVRCSDQVIGVADSSKIDRFAYAQIGPITMLNMLITDKNAPAEFVEGLIARGVKVVTV